MTIQVNGEHYKCKRTVCLMIINGVLCIRTSVSDTAVDSRHPLAEFFSVFSSPGTLKNWRYAISNRRLKPFLDHDHHLLTGSLDLLL
jgi:hypothetical protein